MLTLLPHDHPRHWPGFDRPVVDAPSTVDQRELIGLLSHAHDRLEEKRTMSLLSFDDATLIDVRLVPSEGPHPIWSDDTVSWLLPMLGPSACLLLPRLYGIAATETPQPVDALSFSIGIGRGQLARGLDRLCRFHAVRSVDCDKTGNTIEVVMQTHLPHVSARTRAGWPDWYVAAYDEQFPAPITV